MLRVGVSPAGSGRASPRSRGDWASSARVVIDADRLAREVVAAGHAGLDAVADRFGPQVLAADGRSTGPALGAVVFGDRAARARPRGDHPPARRGPHRRAGGRAPAGRGRRPRRPAAGREAARRRLPPRPRRGRRRGAGSSGSSGTAGLAETDARVADRRPGRRRAAPCRRRRVARQRRHARGSSRPPSTRSGTERLGAVQRQPAAQRVALAARTCRPSSRPTRPWPAQARRLVQRLGHALGQRAVRVDHIGSTSVPGLVAKDVLDLQVGVRDLADADDPGSCGPCEDLGFPRSEGNVQDTVHDWAPDPAEWQKRFHGSARPRPGRARPRAAGGQPGARGGPAVPRLAARPALWRPAPTPTSSGSWRRRGPARHHRLHRRAREAVGSADRRIGPGAAGPSEAGKTAE